MRKQINLSVSTLSMVLALVAHAVAVEPDNTTSSRNRSSHRLAKDSRRSAILGDAWRFKFHDGRWWYWLPSSQWAVYVNQHWVAYKAGTNTLVDGRTTGAASSFETPAKDADTGVASLAPDGARQSAEYHLALGKTHHRHAKEHARLLDKYAALGETVPTDVVMEHAGTIRHDVRQAQKAFAKLADAGKDNPDLIKAVLGLQERLDQVTELIQKLEAEVEQEEAAEAKVIRAQSATISSLLEDSDAAAERADREFYDSHSDSYYSSGEGHFVD